MNDYLKELAELAGIDEPVRKTDYKAMKPYIDITDTVKATAMDKFNKL